MGAPFFVLPGMMGGPVLPAPFFPGIEHGYISTESCILANLPMKPGLSLTWYAGTGRINLDDETNRLHLRPNRFQRFTPA